MAQKTKAPCGACQRAIFLMLVAVFGAVAGTATAQEWRGFTGPTWPAGIRPTIVTTGDFNGDGITDLATANEFSDNVSVLLGNGSRGIGDGTFVAQATYAAGDGTNSVTTSDFNGDGITDLATANAVSSNVSILLGNEHAENPGIGDGTFAVQVTYAVGDRPKSVTAGDFNGDGIIDLATANASSDNVSVLLGNGSGGTGDGTFAAEVPYAVGDYPYYLTTGDFNGDGITDLATANAFSDNVSVLLGNEDVGNAGFGDGTFAAHVTSAVGEFPVSVTTGDFNGDGIIDLVTANANSDDVSVLLGNEDTGNSGFGDGTFAARVNYAVGDSPRSLITGDFNGDGVTDLAITNFSDDKVSVLLGKEDTGNPGAGDGSFTVQKVFAAGEDPSSVITGDFNWDGITDLAIANYKSNSVSVLQGNEDSGNPGFGDGTFAIQVFYATGGSPYSVTTADFNGDGITDLATTDSGTNSLSVLMGNEDPENPGFGEGTFSARVAYATGYGAQSVTTGDFNGDGITDIAAANMTTDKVSVLLGNEDIANPGFGDGTFGGYVAYAAGDGPQSVTTGDFNGDGITDLATANRHSDNVSVLLGNEDAANPSFGDGTFANQVTFAAGQETYSVTTGDFNGDGITDLVTANFSDDNVSVLLGKEDPANPGFGDGTFGAQVTYPAGNAPSSVTTGDFNGDGITDLATANFFSHNVSVLFGYADFRNPGFGDGTFAPHFTYPAGNAPTSVTTGDFNGDGITDLATANFPFDNVSVLLGNERDWKPGFGDGTFGTQITYAAGDAPHTLTTGDFNGDGFTDLVTSNLWDDNVSVLLNLGFTEPEIDVTPTVTPTATPTPEPTATPTPEPTATPTPTPLHPNRDDDRDGLTNGQEETIGTDPRNKDTDGDGFEDGVEVAILTDPLDPNEPADRTDADNDGVPDNFDPDPTNVDTEGDGFLDFYELAVGTDPTDPNDFPALGDVSGNGTINNTDAYLLLEIVLGLRPQGSIPDELLDVNRDGIVDGFDAALLYQYTLGRVLFLPVYTP